MTAWIMPELALVLYDYGSFCFMDLLNTSINDFFNVDILPGPLYFYSNNLALQKWFFSHVQNSTVLYRYIANNVDRSRHQLGNIGARKVFKVDLHQTGFGVPLWASALKGQCHEIFDPRVFFIKQSPLEPFRIWLRIRREKLSRKSSKSASAVT
jgi:hypothetical protein